MYCQNCGKEIENGSDVCKQCGTEVKKKGEAIQTKPQLPSLTANQKATLAALRKYEEKNKLLLGEKGSFSKKYGKLLAQPQKAITEKERLAQKKKQLVERFKNIKIPMHVPLHLPNEIIKEIKEKKVKEISLQKIEKGKRLKLSYTAADGTTKDIATSTANAFSAHSAVTEQQKLPFVGLGVVKGDGGMKLDMLIPSTPPSIKSRKTRNQGDVLYKQNKTAKPTHETLADKTGTQDAGLDNMLSDLISPGTVSNLLGLSQQRLDNVAWQDFSYYEYISEPEIFDLVGEEPFDLQLSKSLLDILDQLDDSALEVNELLGFVAKLQDSVRKMLYITMDRYYFSGASVWAEKVIWDNFYKIVHAYQASLIESGVLSDIYEVYFSIPPYLRIFFPYQMIPYPNSFFSWQNIDYIVLSDWVVGDPAPNQLALDWIQIANLIRSFYSPYITGEEDVERISSQVKEILIPDYPDYPFNVFTPYKCNLGLRLVYRQEWRPLGIQRGETVKTIPLGPKQVEKVSTKITSRKKYASTAEVKTEFEVSTESTDTTKDSSEIVNETAKSKKWNAEGNGSLDLGFFKAGGGGGSSGENEKKHRNTTTHLTESMQKTAGKFRLESKVTVSTESESTFELTTSSEIQNPNDEIPVTYVYSKLQRQYEVLTRLAEVQSVVFIAEPIPLPYQITKEWVKKHDWIIAKVLLDDSFRETLTSISQDLPQKSLSADVQEKINTAMDQVLGTSTTEGFLQKLATNTERLSLSNVDLSQEVQRIYRETHKEELERERSRNLLLEKQERFLQHIRDNILHYCRAIWMEEDSDQRILRYNKLNIRIPTVWTFFPDFPITFSPADLQSIITHDTTGTYIPLSGHFVPNLSDEDTIKPVTEIINPAGPIGFAGNYAIFHIKSDDEIIARNRWFAFNMLHYMKSFYMDPENGEFIDPIIRSMKDINSTSYVPVPDPILKKEKKEMVDYVPEIRAEYEGLDEKEKEAFIDDGLLPEERKEYDAIANANDKKDFLKANSCFEDPDLYYEYWFRKEYSRRFLVDTNNLILDLEAGTGSALETFKKLHRYVDVLKAIEEEEKMDKENKRRQGLLDKEKYGDPDIEKVILVSDSNQLASLVAGVEVSGSPDDSGENDQ